MKNLLFFFIVVLTSWTAWAHDPGGRWTSSSGARVDLWANMEQVTVTVTTQEGQQYRYNGRWTRFSDTFQYTANQLLYQAAFQGPNEIVVTSPGQPTRIWTRGSTTTVQGFQASGLYSSSSGSTVQIQNQKPRIFVTIVNPQGKRFEGSGSWISPYRFEYTVPGQSGKAVCTVNARNPNEGGRGATP